MLCLYFNLVQYKLKHYSKLNMICLSDIVHCNVWSQKKHICYLKSYLCLGYYRVVYSEVQHHHSSLWHVRTNCNIEEKQKNIVLNTYDNKFE